MRESQKLERAQVKAERKALRRAAEAEEAEKVVSYRSEAELIDDLRSLQTAFEAGEMSAEDFEEQRARIQAQFDRFTP